MKELYDCMSFGIRTDRRLPAKISATDIPPSGAQVREIAPAHVSGPQERETAPASGQRWGRISGPPGVYAFAEPSAAGNAALCGVDIYAVRQAVRDRLLELAAAAGYRFTDATGAAGAFLLMACVSPGGAEGLPAAVLTELRTLYAERISDRRPRLRAYLTLVSAPPGCNASDAPQCADGYEAAGTALHRRALDFCRGLAGLPGVEAATDFSASVRGAPTLGGSVVLDAVFDITTY